MSWIALAALTACDRGSAASVPLEDWCYRVEAALEARRSACGCPMNVDEAAIDARCDAFPATSLDTAIAGGELLWVGTRASDVLDQLESMGDCQVGEVADEPLFGNVPVGDPCRVLADVAGAPDDCVFDAVCVETTEGPRCVAREERCAIAPCAEGTCVDGECVVPVCR